MNRQLVVLGFLLGTVVATLALSAQNPRVPNATEFRVKLLSQISTETSKKGDKLTAQVISPQEFTSYFMEGQVRAAKSGKGKSTLSFYCDALETPERSAKIPVRSSIKYMVNSQGKSGVDEEGNVVAKTNNLGKAAVATGLGALIGAAAGGGRGAAIGAGVGAAAALVFIEFHGQSATRITFAPGSEFVMSVKER